MQNLTCIAIDDDPLFLKKLQAFTEEIDWLTIVNTFDNPVEGATEIIKTEPDLLILDINMPYMDGYRLIDWIVPKLSEFKKQPKIVVVTADTTLIQRNHKAVTITCFKPDIRSPEDLENSLIKLLN